MQRSEIREHFDRHGPMVFRRARQLLGNDADAEEATQEVFIRALRRGDTFDGRASASTWLYRITTNYCLNIIRDRKRRNELWDEQVAPAATRSQAAGTGTDRVAIRRLLAEADEQMAGAAVCVFVDGMSHAEAAEVLQVSRRTVGNLLERFTKWAAERLGGGESP